MTVRDPSPRSVARRERPRCGRPLSTAHNRPQPLSERVRGDSRPAPGTLEVAVGGSFVQLHGSPGPPMRPGRRGPRGAIKDFSRASRRRLLHAVESLDWQAALRPAGRVLWFLTLTVHHDEGLERAHAAKEALRRRLYRACPSTAIVWKLEPQKRGAPHYHLLVVADLAEVAALVGGPAPRSEDELDADPFELLRRRMEAWFLDSWREVTGQASITRVALEEPRSTRGVRAYVVGYLAKKHSVPEHWRGRRYWGIWGEWPRSTRVFWLDEKSRWRLRRMVRAWSRSIRRRAQGERGRAASRSRPWADRYGGVRVCIPTELLARMCGILQGVELGTREGPPGLGWRTARGTRP